jgi:hypothetical protein
MQLHHELATVETAYHCARCLIYKQATVATVGLGTGYLGAPARNAAADAVDSVPMLLRLKRCPACGFFDERLSRRNLRTRRAALAAIILIFALTAAAVGALAWTDPALRWFALLIGPLLVLVFRSHARMLRARYPATAEDRVTLVEPAAVASWRPAAPVPTTREGGFKWL